MQCWGIKPSTSHMPDYCSINIIDPITYFISLLPWLHNFEFYWAFIFLNWAPPIVWGMGKYLKNIFMLSKGHYYFSWGLVFWAKSLRNLVNAYWIGHSQLVCNYQRAKSSRAPAMDWILCPQNLYVEAITPQCGCMWKQGL